MPEGLKNPESQCRMTTVFLVALAMAVHRLSEALWKKEETHFHPFASNPEELADPDNQGTIYLDIHNRMGMDCRWLLA